jgi:VIT1/CCC1 family predicted Fe2+/Mn2+ transporter
MTETAVAASPAASAEAKSPVRVLDPLDRFSEILFGVIMVLTFTVSLRVARADKTQVHEMLLGALGCNLAWGLIDGIMYLMAVVSARGHNVAILRKLHREADAARANRIIADELPPVVVAALPAGALDGMRQNLRKLPDLPARPHLHKDDWWGALGVFLLVFLSTFPIVVPFLFVSHIRLAGRISDAIGMAMLFLSGYSYGRYAGHSAWGWGLSMVAIGGIMIGLCIALGG